MFLPLKIVDEEALIGFFLFIRLKTAKNVIDFVSLILSLRGVEAIYYLETCPHFIRFSRCIYYSGIVYYYFDIYRVNVGLRFNFQEKK